MSLRDLCVEVLAREHHETLRRRLVPEWPPYEELGDIDLLSHRKFALLAFDAILDTLSENDEEWQDLQAGYPQLYEVAPSKVEHLTALGILPSDVSHRRVTRAVVTDLIAALRDTETGPQ